MQSTRRSRLPLRLTSGLVLLLTSLLASEAHAATKYFGPNNKYFYSDETVLGTAAESKCQLLGPSWHLATINDSTENTFIFNNTWTSTKPFIWIGLNDRAVENTFVWYSGEASTFRNWHPKEPNNVNNEDCVHLVNSGLWNDARCGVFDNRAAYVCENHVMDSDADGAVDGVDNCLTVANPTQADFDHDGVGDACDDRDGDGVVDATDVCPLDNPNDGDGDGRCTSDDNCGTTANADQADFDHDGAGDVCDPDWDGDSVLDGVDLCLGWSDAIDTDSDTVPDGPGDGSTCDICPLDPQNDADGDGWCESADNCEDVTNEEQADFDIDGVGDACDNCPLAQNDDQADVDNDTVGNACDNCPSDANLNQQNSDTDGLGDVCDDDDDGDGVTDVLDVFPYDPTEWSDTDGDHVGDNSDICPTDPLDLDDDEDGVCDVSDVCLGSADNDADADGDQVCDHNDICWGNDITLDDDQDWYCGDLDNCPVDENADQADADSDGIGNVCEADTDQDGTIDDYDNCVSDYNVDQANTDGDDEGDACDADDDGDGAVDGSDNCPLVANASQANFDGDELGDACDGDDDADVVADGDDLCPSTSLGSLVNSNGCSGTQFVALTCNAASFTNHGKYVSCVAHATNTARSQGLITGPQGGVIVSAAAKSSVGK